jgi:dUTP pyrophosphatase
LERVGKFEKVSYKQFYESIKEGFDTTYTDEQIREIYDQIKLPQRATWDSAGNDFYAPFDFYLNPGESIKVPTGIRVHINDGWFLACVPRSGLGFKFCESLANTIGIVDSQYVNSDNEGHIFVKIVNRSNENKAMRVNKGQGFVQGIFLPFGITFDDDITDVRNGGMGSTDKKPDEPEQIKLF